MRFENGLFQLNPEFIRAPSEVSEKIANPGELVIAGYATTYDKGLDNAIISRKALSNAAADLKKRSTVLFNHDQNRPIGRIHEVKLDDKGLFTIAIIDKTEQEIQEKIKSGTLNKFSIRGRILASHEEWDENSGKSTSVIDNLKLLEVSVVSVPAVDEAEIQSWYVQRSANDNDFVPLQRDVNLEQGGDKMSDKETKELEEQELEEKEEAIEEEEGTEELIEAVESSQLELLLDLDERVSTLVERTDELLKAANLDAVMKKLDEAMEMLKKILDKLEKYPYPYPYPYPAKKSAEIEESVEELDLEEEAEEPMQEVLESVRALADEVKELKETVVVRGEKTEEAPEDAIRQFLESEEYKNADPSEKMRMLWDFTEKYKGGEK